MQSKATWRGTVPTHLRAVLVPLLLVAVALSATPPRIIAADPFDDVIQHDLQFAAQQLDATARTVAADRYPSTTSSSGSWNTTGASGWTSGFFPGSMWFMYQRTNDPSWQSRAAAWTAGLESQKNDTSTHDIGFKIFTSFGNGYRLTSNDAYRQVLLAAAGSLAKRYDPDVGCIRSWGEISDTSNFEVIIDNMMNLELLFWASKHGGQAAWYDMAVSHALKTMTNHVRADDSTYQVVTYDPASGAVKSKSTKQGYNTESTWSRGQAWAVYGFTMAYRETGDPRFLDTARRTADYFIAHLPRDKVPYWDFELPSVTDQPRDSSAAAIAASGLLELSQRETDAQHSATYLNAARDILTSLSSPAYLAEGTTNKAILLHGTQNKPDGKYDRGLIYGDYYFIEALLRYPTTPPPPDTTPPTITARAPAPGAVNVPLGANVTATFSEAVTNVTLSTFTLRRGTTQIAANISYDVANRTATLDPSAELIASTVYTATLTNGIADLAGNPLAPVSWTFTTAVAPPPGGTRIKTITFEDGSLTHPTSGVDSINGTVKLLSPSALKGTYSAQIPSTSAYLQETFADADEIFVSLYLRLDALPSADSRIVLLSNDGTTVGNLLLRPDGTLLLRNASTAIGSPSAALRAGMLYQIGLHQKRGGGSNAVLEAYVTTGDAALGAPFASSQTLTFTSAADRLRFGATTGALNVVFDDITLDAEPLP